MAWGTPLERFWEKVVKIDSGCWQWVGGKKAAGYGQFSVGGKKVIAHRWAYLHFTGPIPEGYEVDHLCRNTSCVNPRHLEAVSLPENRRRRNADKTHCVNGHRYTEQTTYWWTDVITGYRSRRCRICNADSVRRTSKRAGTGESSQLS